MSPSRLTGTNHKTAALWNRGLVLRLLRQHGSLSRRQISQMTGLRGSTLTYIVRELMDKNVLRSLGKGKSTGVGKKQVMLDVNPELGYVLGISLRHGTAQLLLMDAAGTRLSVTRTATDLPLETVPTQLHTAYQAWVGEMPGRPPGKLLAVGLGISGVVDAEQGIVLKSIALNSENVSLRKLVSDQFDVPVVIDNDACFGAVEEATEGVARDQSHFVYFSMSYVPQNEQNVLNSFGSALWLEGHVYRGAHFAAGEIGLPLAPRRDIVLDDADLACLSDRDAALTPAAKQVAQTIGDTFSAIANFLDIPMIVLGGNCNVANARFLRAVRHRMDVHLVPVIGREIRVEPSRNLGETVARGAAISALQATLEGGWLLAGATA